jgi:hypothetical protein
LFENIKEVKMIIANLLSKNRIELESGRTGDKLLIEMRDYGSALSILTLLDNRSHNVAITSTAKDKVEC